MYKVSTIEFTVIKLLFRKAVYSFLSLSYKLRVRNQSEYNYAKFLMSIYIHFHVDQLIFARFCAACHVLQSFCGQCIMGVCLWNDEKPSV